MKLVQRHWVKFNHPSFRQIDSLTFLSKNLYNSILYICRQAFFQGNPIPTMNQLYHLIKASSDYKALPAKISQLVIKQVDKAFSSYSAAIKEYKQYPNKFKAAPRLPRYKHKVKGRNILTYNYQAVSKKALKKGLVKLSGTTIEIKSDLTELDEVRLIPRIGGYVIEIVYQQPELQPREDNNNYGFIDLGLNNLCTLTSNKKEFQPRLLCGKALKSCNQNYNKRLACLKSKLPQGQRTSRKIQALTFKRNRKVDYYLHTTTRYIIDLLVKNEINMLVIGSNKDWKQNINLGKRNNQNFVSIPHYKLIQQLTYKAQLLGIKVVINEESYTSKCSFLDLEPVGKSDTYKGKRINRGLFKAASGYLYSADVNGSLNIGRKVVGEAAFSGDSIERFVVNPLRVKPYKAESM